ncbi:MAG: ATP-grasp domain-containing protein [Phycisphaerae bacterium]|jgi:carbamoyl-phosphate synthase large subunit
MPRTAGQSDSLTLLFTCVGRRIELLQAFRAAARRLRIGLRLVAVDSDVTAPGLTCADEGVVLPRVDDPAYIPALLDTVRRVGAQALVPTVDTDLILLSEHRQTLVDLGCVPLIAEPDVIGNCRNKLRTFEFLRAQGIDTPQTYTPEQTRALAEPPFPLFGKPLCGSASQRVRKLVDRLDLDYYLQRYNDVIIQEFIEGQEYTLDVYVGLTGEPRCVVPRARWQTRTGEVCKGVVVKDPAIMEAGRRVVTALGPSPRGLVTLQCIVTKAGRICFIEINPRFGGGAPLGIAAGADYPAWILQELLGRKPRIQFDGFRHGLAMLRYDWSVFLQLDDDLHPKLTTPLRPWPPFK